MTTLEEKRAIAERWAPKGMGCGISDRIRLGFYDAPTQAPNRKIVHQSLSDEIAGKLDGVDGQFRAAKTRDPRTDCCWPWHAHKIKTSHLTQSPFRAERQRSLRGAYGNRRLPLAFTLKITGGKP